MCREVTKRKDVYEGQHVKIVGVSKNYWRCQVMTGPDAGTNKKFQPYHVAKWLERKKPPPPLSFPPAASSGSSGAQGAAEEVPAKEPKADLMDVFGCVDGY